MIIKRVLSLLDEKSLKMADLCRYLGINTSTMANWKNRETDPPAKYIIPICEFLNVSCEFLLTGQENGSHNAVDSNDSDWLALIHKLPIERRYELKGYAKRMLDEELLAGIPETAEDAAKLDVNYDYSHDLPSADEVRKHGVSNITNSNVG